MTIGDAGVTEPSSKPRRRLLSFSLRGILLLVLVVSVALAWTLREARKQGIVVAALEKMGCAVHFGGSDGGPTTVIEWLRSELGDIPFTDVMSVNACATEMNDAAMAEVRSLTELHRLELTGTLVSDAGLIHLKKLPQLRNLSLQRTQVTDSGTRELQDALPNMQITR